MQLNRISGFIFFILSLNFSAVSQTLNLKVNKVLTIGGPEIEKEGYLFIAPQEAFTDSSGNIYVRDVVTTMGFHSQSIKKFDANGKYLLTIGKKGRGPGEFLRILSFCINQNNEILTYDEINRRYSIFSTGGKLLRNFRATKRGYFSLHALRTFSTNKFLIAHEQIPEYKINNVFTVFKSDMKKILFSFGTKKDFQNNTDPLFEEIFYYEKIPFALLDTTKLLGSHIYYNGCATFMENKDGKWISKEIKAHRCRYTNVDRIPEKYVKSGNYSAYKNPGGLIISSGYNGKVYGYLIRNFTAGIFPFQKDKFIQFILILIKKGEYEFGFNLFSDSGEFLGYQKIKNYTDIFNISF